MASFGAFLTYLFSSFPQEEEKMKQMNTLNISDFINKCANYISRHTVVCRAAQVGGAPHREYIYRKKVNAIFTTL